MHASSVHTPYVADAISIPRAYISYGITAATIIALAVYGYLLVSSVMHVVALRGMEAEMDDLQRSVHALEARQVHAIHDTTLEYAAHRGFVVATRKVFLDESHAVAVRR